MDRRAFLSSTASFAMASGIGLLPAKQAAAAQDAVPEVPAGWRRFEITTCVTLLDAPGAAQLWLPLAQSADGYQAALDLTWQGNGHADMGPDAKYGADLLRVDWNADADQPKTAEVVQTVATRDRDGTGRHLPVTAAERRFWLQPTRSRPTDGIVRATAERIVAGKQDPRERLRAIYDWVVDNTFRDPETAGCGVGDIRSMLESGNLGGKCADINGLMTGLARAAGFPARDVYGIRVADSRQFRALGASGVISKAQHCRSEAYLDGVGWLPLDPADVRKMVLDHRLAVDSPEVRALRDRLFGSWEMNWVGYNSATDIILPGVLGQQKPNFAFPMYPCASTSGGQPDCLDPARFRYEITSRELTG